MADTVVFFEEYLPTKISEDPDLARSVGAVFQFNVDGAGTWTLDLTGEGSVSPGPAESAGCIVATDRETWEMVLDKPSLAVQMFMRGKIKASNIGLAMSLQKLLS